LGQRSYDRGLDAVIKKTGDTKLLEPLAKLCAMLAGARLTDIPLLTCGNFTARKTAGDSVAGAFALSAGAAMPPGRPGTSAKRDMQDNSTYNIS